MQIILEESKSEFTETQVNDITDDASQMTVMVVDNTVLLNKSQLKQNTSTTSSQVNKLINFFDKSMLSSKTAHNKSAINKSALDKSALSKSALSVL